MHFKLVPGYSDPGISYHLLGVRMGVGICMERDLVMPEISTLLPKRDHSRSWGLPVVQGVGGWDFLLQVCACGGTFLSFMGRGHVF